MKGPDVSSVLESAPARLRRIMYVLALTGTIVLWIWKGAPWGSGFLLGAALAIGSFQLTDAFVRGIRPDTAPRKAALRGVIVGSRYLLIGAILYVMMRFLGLNLVAALCGLLVAGAAALLEIVYELFHGT